MATIEDQSNGAALVIHQLRKSFADVVAVNGLNLEVKRGECFGLLGPNGAGKTTTIEICEGLISPDAGTVEIFGQSWRDHADRKSCSSGSLRLRCLAGNIWLRFFFGGSCCL